MKNKFILNANLTIRSESGMVLIIGLVMVLLLSIIALAAIRGSGLQESMAGNMREKNVAFQAAESALRECEERDLGPARATFPPPTCLDGSGACNDLDKTPANSPVNNDVFWRQKARAIEVEIPDVVSQPTCLVEVLQNTDPKASAAAIGSGIGRGSLLKTGFPTPYRVTAQGVGAMETTPAVVQSTFKRFFQ